MKLVFREVQLKMIPNRRYFMCKNGMSRSVIDYSSTILNQVEVIWRGCVTVQLRRFKGVEQ